MLIRAALLIVGILSASTAAHAQANTSQQAGTPEQRAACGHDVRRFCRHLKETDGPFAYLQCFESNRSKLSPRCIGMLQSYGM
jgi:hypothetical protein